MSRTLQPDPVIVTGAPRTGVRLLAAILDGHPSLASGPDLPVIATVVRQWHEIRCNLAEHHERNHRLPPDASRVAFRDAALRLFAPRLERTGKQQFVLQTFTASLLLDQFASLFTNARFILTVRDPRDAADSLLRCDWRDVRSGERLPYTRDPVAAARFTIDFMNPGLENARALEAEGRLMRMQYENLEADPGDAMERLGSFLRQPPARPFVSPGSADLVVQSMDNPHPALRIGPVKRVGPRRPASRPLEAGPANSAMKRLLRSLGYDDREPRDHGR